MKKGIMRKISSMVLCALLAFGPILPVDATDKVVLGSKNYEVELDAAGPVFLGNAKAVDFSGGDSVFLTYTVDSVKMGDNEEYVQHGVVASQNKDEIYPYYEIGLIDYSWESQLLREGYTYFFKFQVTEFGFECVAVYAKDQEENYINFPNRSGEVMEDMKYAGIWFAGKSATGKLSHVRCYDEKGNDLGVATNSANMKNGVTIYDPSISMEPNKKVKHTYEFELKDAYNIAISNAKPTDADVVYMEYKVKDSQNNMNQTGLEMTNSPTVEYPHASGAYLIYETMPDKTGSVLAISGASYVIRFERMEDGFEGLVKYTKGKETKYLKFPLTHGKYDEDYEYFNLWFGDGVACTLSAKFEDFKCYDEAGNNLGVQTNQQVEVIRHGGLEDYSTCEAVYYCKDNKTFIALDDEQYVTVQVDGSEDSVLGQYIIDGLTLTMDVDGQKTEYTYYYRSIKDQDGKEYIRLKESTVKFVAGDEQTSQVAYASESFKVQKPEDPMLKNYSFKAWCLGDGTEFDFNQVVTENTTLYAKWIDGNGNEYLAVEADGGAIVISDVAIGIGVSVLLVALTVVGIILISKGGKKHEK